MKHPRYIFDKDDDFDSTYATFYFTMPKKLETMLNKADKKWKDKIQNTVNMSDVWHNAIENMKVK